MLEVRGHDLAAGRGEMGDERLDADAQPTLAGTNKVGRLQGLDHERVFPLLAVNTNRLFQFLHQSLQPVAARAWQTPPGGRSLSMFAREKTIGAVCSRSPL
ncbi:MAG: hypothetical protein KDA38_09820 [Planctomycetales bacterium]|nr:hypothetical protein [Planctomycetales bacterium]